MLIRSQNNDRLINFDHIGSLDICRFKKSGGYYLAAGQETGEECFVITAGTCKIAEYGTEEAAIKVLDMVEGHYTRLMRALSMPDYLEIMPVFQMPSEEEAMMEEGEG